jgi:hypothetical protein
MATAQQTLNSPGSDAFTQPTVTQLILQAGCNTTGSQVTIIGSNFTGASTVMFGQASAIFTVQSDSTIIAIVPAGSGTVNVIVTTPSGSSLPSPASQFFYNLSCIKITIDQSRTVTVNPSTVLVTAGAKIKWVADFSSSGSDPFPFAVCFGNPLFPTPIMIIGANITGFVSETEAHTISSQVILGLPSKSSRQYSYSVVCMSPDPNGGFSFPSTDPVVIVSPS